jgi:Protein of unknown function (DUF2474)
MRRTSSQTLLVDGENGEERQAPRYRRLAWFAGIWICSVAALGIVALAIRWALRP